MKKKFRLEKDQPVPLLEGILRQRGWERTHDDDWRLYWGAIPAPPRHGAASPCHANHFRRTALISHKGSLARHLAAARRRAIAAGRAQGWDFFPETHEMPSQFDAFCAAARAQPHGVWIAKPTTGTHGDGQFLLIDPARAPVEPDWVVQRYLAHPHLIEGRKYTLRLYALVKSLRPLVAYLHVDGLVKRSTVAYSTAPADFGDRFVHLTNTDVQRHSPGGSPPALRVRDYRAIVGRDGGDWTALWGKIRAATVRLLLALREPLLRADGETAPGDPACFELLGIDFLIDADWKPWLIEANSNPSLRVETPSGVAGHEDERQLKQQLIETALELAGPLADRPIAIPPHIHGGFELLFPDAGPTAWTGVWWPRLADCELSATLGLPAPAPPTIRLPAGAQLVEDGLIVVAPGAQHLLALNETAAAIALLHDEGFEPSEIARRLGVENADTPGRNAFWHEIDEVLASLWSASAPAPDAPANRPHPERQQPAGTGLTRCYTLGVFSFRVIFPDAALMADADAALGHLRIDDSGGPMHLVAIEQAGGRLCVRNAFESFTTADSAALVSLLHSAMLRAICHLEPTAVAFHASAVAHEGAGLILAGRSGSGKTTLAAALMVSGFAYLSDEAALLDEAFRLQPAPVALGLTPAAVELLRPFPGSREALSIRRRRDGTAVHFLTPQNISTAPDEVAALVFPVVAPGEETELRPLGPVAALTRLGETGFETGEPFDSTRGHALVGWLRRTPRYELRIGSLAAAVERLAGLAERSSTSFF
ncbi:MAG TPA: hypothetical protein VHE13_09430 [Opitutus sp.]|nr:hypothetical protein [Opitutus sp.]